MCFVRWQADLDADDSGFEPDPNDTETESEDGMGENELDQLRADFNTSLEVSHHLKRSFVR